MHSDSEIGNKDHFAGSLISMQKQLYYYALQLTDNREHALDLVQETSYKALKNRKRLQSTDQIRAWLYTILKNTYINYLRSSHNRNLSYNSDEVSMYSDSSKELGSTLPDILLQRKELRELINLLPVSYEQPINMMLSGYSYKEIAKHMDIPIGTVKSRIHLGKKRIRKEYAA